MASSANEPVQDHDPMDLSLEEGDGTIETEESVESEMAKGHLCVRALSCGFFMKQNIMCRIL